MNIVNKEKQKEKFDIRVAASIDRFAVKTANLPKIIKLPVGIILIVLGTVMLVIPGPGLITLICGLVLVSPPAAKFVKNTSERYINWRNRNKKIST